MRPDAGGGMTGVGHNMPPRHEAFAMALEEMRLEAGNFLDGAPVETQGQADAIGKIISTAKKIRKDADAARKEDKEPHLEAGRAVDTNYKPVIDTCDTIVTAAQKPLTVYLTKLAAEQAEAERKARMEADRLAQEAIAAQRASEGNVEAIERAKGLQAEADEAEKLAKRAGKAKAHVAGVDRAVGLRTYNVVTVTDRRAALLWIAKHDEAALDAFVAEYARRNGCARMIDGVTVTEERRVA